MRFGGIGAASLLVGGLWGGLWIIIVAVLFVLINGIVVPPSAVEAIFAGAVGALACLLLGRFKRQFYRVATVSMIVGTVFGLLTRGQAFSTSMPDLLVERSIAFLVFSLCVGISISVSLRGFRFGPATRYQLEVLLIRLFKGLGYVIFTILVALPFYLMVVTSLKSQQLLLSNPLDLSVDFRQEPLTLFRSYIELFTQFRFGTFILNSAIVSVATVALTLIFAIPGAYAVARLRFKGRSMLSRSILLIYMVPGIVLVVPLYAVFSQLGLRNTLGGLLLVYPATTIPVALYMLQGYFRGLPTELEEAGLMDGQSRLGVIWKITLPLSVPALASVSLYVFMIAWNEFLFAFMFLDDLDIYTLSRGVVSLNSSEIPRQHLMAGAVVATVPILLLFLWFERFLVAGLTSGSVKG